MALPVGLSLTQKLVGFVTKRDYSLNSALDFVESASDEIKILCGSVTPVDPTDPGEMALANRGYVDRAHIQAVQCLSELNVAKIKSITDVVRNQGLMIKKLESNDLVLLGLAEGIIHAKSNATSSLADLGSSTLKGAAAALWAVPGVNVAFGVAAYGGGIFLDWFKSKTQSSRLRDDLSLARHLILENAVPVAVYDDIDRVLRNKDTEDYGEVVSDWISTQEAKLFENESRSFDLCLTRNDIMFIKSSDDRDVFSIALILVRQGSPVYYVTIVNLKDKSCRTREFAYMRGDIKHEMINYISYEMCGNGKGRALIASRTPKMAPDDVLVERLKGMRDFVRKLGEDGEECRSLIHAYVQSGVPT